MKDTPSSFISLFISILALLREFRRLKCDIVSGTQYREFETKNSKIKTQNSKKT